MLNQMLEQTRKELKEVEAKIPPDLNNQINRIVTSKGEDAFAAVSNRNCSACQTSITSQNYNELSIGTFILCVACGRILYLSE